MKNGIRSWQIRKFLAVSILAGWSLNVWATGFRLPDQDAFATARGEAFAATADNASAIYYNPAGLSQLDGDNVRGGVYILDLNVKYTSPTTGQEFDNQKQWHGVPQLFYSHSFSNSPFTVGIGFYAPYGLSSEWQQNTGFRTLATQGSLSYYTINPTVAWQVFTNFSIGVGARISYTDIDLQRGLVWPAQSYDQFRFSGNGWAYGYDLGFLWKVHEKVSLGVTFKSTSEANYSGNTSYYNNVAFPPGVGLVPAFPNQNVSASTKVEFPLNAVLGVSYRPTPEWNIEFNADYTDWSTLGTLTIQQAHGFAGLIPPNVPVVLDWQESWYYEFGATRYLGGGWSVSGGYIYNENSVPDAHYNPLVADLNRHFFSIGGGYNSGRHFSFDVAYQFGYGPTRTVTGSAPSATGQTADGQYRFLSQALFLTAGWHF